MDRMSSSFHVYAVWFALFHTSPPTYSQVKNRNHYTEDELYATRLPAP